MPILRLTDLAIQRLKPSGKQVLYYCDQTANFGLRLSQAGGKSFFVNVGTARKRVSLGKYPATSLKDAREEAKRVLLDPASSAIQQTLEKAIESFIDIHHAKSRPSQRKEQERLLRKHLLSRHDKTSVGDVAKSDINKILDALVDTPSEQLHAYRCFKTFFSWTTQRDLTTASPLATIQPPSKQSERARLPTDNEMKVIHRAAQRLGYPFGHITLIAIHTGLRRGEIGALKWEWITDEHITIPKDIAKNGVEHVLPNLIGEFLKTVPRTSEYLFPTSTNRPFIAWGKNHKKLVDLSKIKDITLHDWRRYLSSTMRRLKVDIDVTECILNHVSGSRSNIQRIYDRFDRIELMREALQHFESHLKATLGNEP